MVMKIAILGYGKQGKSAYQHWKKPDNQITVCDRDQSLDTPNDVEAQLGPHHLENLNRFDLIVRSPTIHPAWIVAANSKKILEKVTTNTNEFFKVCPTKNIIGITGTKGKGTTSTLIAKMLEAAGKRVHLGGNIGIAPLELLKNNIQPEDWVVLELANFQLIDLRYSPHIAVCLMVVDEHLDWHVDAQEYIEAKKQLFAHQSRKDAAIFYAHNKRSIEIAAAGNGKKIPYMHLPGATVNGDIIGIGSQAIAQTKQIKLLGEHNWQNVCAAITAVWQISKNTEAIRTVIETFRGLEHRLEFVREISGVKYYDDSFGTTPETAIVAIKAFKDPKVVILGGSDKGSNYGELARAVKANNVRGVVVIGQMKEKIRQALQKVGFDDVIDGGDTMTDIVETAKEAAGIGDIVLLSTGCASFGMFKNYEDRGQQFKAAVQALV